MAKEEKKRKRMGLGKGLDALFPDIGKVSETKDADYFFCDTRKIRPNPYQPRREFAENEMAELADSVKSRGVLQPLLVRRAGDGYELIAGERRLRAAKIAGLKDVPVIVHEIEDDQLLELSIIENIQRENLNPMEEAEAYHRLINEFGLIQEQVAQRVGKSRSAVANFLRLNQLPDEIKASLRKGKLAMGHARALLAAETPAIQRTAWQTVVSKNLSVRETEKLVVKLNAQKDMPKQNEKGPDDIYFSSVEEELGRHFGTKVQIKRQGKKGKVEIEFYGNEDLDRLLSLLKT
ncbi:MAG: ParB/RepB/Spo0J family partition protein [Deltaproteobacteria bacterium]|nr:ParB/RepB/Spo0J family partition protein [Deltaproteobacteria bacterium]